MGDNFQIQQWVVSPRLNGLRNNGRMVHLEPKVMQVLVPGEIAGRCFPRKADADGMGGYIRHRRRSHAIDLGTSEGF